jgi:hypothetical protein
MTNCLAGGEGGASLRAVKILEPPYPKEETQNKHKNAVRPEKPDFSDKLCGDGGYTIRDRLPYCVARTRRQSGHTTQTIQIKYNFAGCLS